MSRRLVALLSGAILCCVLSLAPRPAHAQDSAVFVDSGQRLGGESSYAVALGDLDGDGDLDALLANGAGERSQVWTNDGRGHFTLAGDLRDTGDARDVALGDLDGDGDLDALLVNAGGSPTLVWLNDGTGTFGSVPQKLGSGSSLAAVLADFDGDGDLDAYIANGQPADPAADDAAGSTTLADELWLNDGAGHFDRAERRLSDSSAQDVTAGDFDGDGDVDIYLATGKPQGQAATPDELWLNAGDATFTRGALPRYPRNCASFAAPAFGVATAALDSRPGLDILVANGVKECYYPNAVLLSANYGTFTLADPFPNAPAPGARDTNTAVAVALGDIDGDGHADAFVVEDESASDELWLGHGDGTFDRKFIASPEFTVDVALGDLNGDGFLDAFLANRNNGPNRVLLNRADGRFTSQPLTTDLPGVATAAGDLNGDGWLDAVVVNGDAAEDTIFLNDRTGRLVASPQPFNRLLSRSVALGDLDNDATLDAFVVNAPGYASRVWLNVDGSGVLSETVVPGSDGGQDVALGDLDGDGDLDAFVASGELDGARGIAKPNSVWFNSGGAFAPNSEPFTPQSMRLGPAASMGVALGDLDGDGDLDAVVANARGGLASEVWLNNGAGTFHRSQFLQVSDARGVTLGDFDGDGDLDAFVVNGYRNQAHRVFLNNSGGLLVDSGQSLGATNGNDAAAGDFDGDGDLDVLVASQGPDQLWLNDGSGVFSALARSLGNADSRAALSGDFNNDGALDALVVSGERINGPAFAGHHTVLLNRSPAYAAAQVTLSSPAAVNADFYAAPQILQTLALPFAFAVSTDVTAPLAQPQLLYSFNGGGQWLRGAFTTGVVVDGVTPAVWNLAESGFFGRSDNVALRLVVPMQPSSAVAGSYTYTNQVAGPYLWPSVSAVTFPFRARGLQVRVVDGEGRGVAGAQVFRRPKDQIGLLAAMQDATGRPYLTDDQGYLQGRGALATADQLAALAPVAGTHAFTMYFTDMPVVQNNVGISAVQRPNLAASGVQTLTITPENTLLLFDLDIALEWDARNDGNFLADLEAAIKRASDLLYDVTVGQAALGEVRIHLDKDAWATADVVLYASNSIHPRASMGGVVLDYTDDYSGTTRIPDAYMPGQIRMGPLWDPFGQNQTDLQQDWWRAFAHELAHYLLFLPDNYLGVEDGLLVTTDCKGSFMTSAYDEDRYGGFLIRDGWVGPCLDTVAQRLLTGRTDWETITTFLPLVAPATSSAAANGPANIPLAVTQVRVITETRAAQGRETLPARNFDLRDESENLAVLRQAQGYVFHSGPTRPDEYPPPVTGLIALGSTGSGRDRIMVRGAAPGDRVCVFDTQHNPPRTGCTVVKGNNPTVRVSPVPGWQPEIVASPVASTTLLITVTQAVADRALRAQIIPAYGPDGPPVETPATVLRRLAPDQPDMWTGAITLTYPAFEGYVRVWVDGQESAPREAVTQYFLSAGWGPPGRGGAGAADDRAEAPIQPGAARVAWGPPGRGGAGAADVRAGWGPPGRGGAGASDTRVGWGPPGRGGAGAADVRAMGANRRTMEAPVSSGDGRVTIFKLDDLLGDSGALTLQALNEPPQMAPWLTPVGKAYRFAATEPFTRTIAFNYLQRDVPEGFEPVLRLYFLPDGGGWQPLDTRLDADENLAAARMPAQANGVYVLAASVELPQLQEGWNLLAYTIPETRTVDVALASIRDDFTAVYQYDPATETGWRIYDNWLQANAPEFAELVNDLPALAYGQSYLIYATQTVTPYLAVPGPQAAVVQGAAATSDGVAAAAAPAGPLLPAPASQVGTAPAVYYGILVASPGASVVARVGAVECGRAETRPGDDGALRYVLRVASAAQLAGCGEPGTPVEFVVDGSVAAIESWSNNRALRVDLAAGP
ncbi:MAG: VCBS repeat-containing protein [Caldilinea sp.]|nr:VCBS repeat-containing protein [Caldilinea sp.]